MIALERKENVCLDKEKSELRLSRKFSWWVSYGLGFTFITLSPHCFLHCWLCSPHTWLFPLHIAFFFFFPSFLLLQSKRNMRQYHQGLMLAPDFSQWADQKGKSNPAQCFLPNKWKFLWEDAQLLCSEPAHGRAWVGLSLQATDGHDVLILGVARGHIPR